MKHLVCIHKGEWISWHGEIGFGPKEGEIVEVIGDYAMVGWPDQLKIKGYVRDAKGKQQGFGKVHFREVDETFGEWVEETVLKEAVLEHALA